MSQQPTLSWLTQPKAVLRVGRAPAYWQRQLASSTARLKALMRACAWLPQIGEVAIELREGPLLGHCLADLTGRYREAALSEIAQPTESPLAVSRFQPTQPQWSELGQNRQQGETAKNPTSRRNSRLRELPERRVVPLAADAELREKVGASIPALRQQGRSLNPKSKIQMRTIGIGGLPWRDGYNKCYSGREAGLPPRICPPQSLPYLCWQIKEN